MRAPPEPRTFRITRADLAAYAEASGDHNPIHRDDEVARSVGLPGVIAHGMFTLALVARYLAESGVASEDVLELGGKFTKPVPVPPEGTEVQIAATRRGDDDRHLVVEVTAQGERVFGPRGVRVSLRG